MDTVDKYIEWISILANSLVIFGGWYLLFRKAKPEIEKAKADAVAESAAAAQSYANAAKVYADELKEVREELRILRLELDTRDRIIIEQKIIIDDLKDWAQRLMFQVRSLNAIPVPMKIQKKGKKSKTIEELNKFEENLKEPNGEEV